MTGSNGVAGKWIVLVALAASLLGVGWFVVMSAMTYRVGFPLDDAWIHQTYARNLAQLGEWAFVPGEKSGGSTSPLWTLLLAIGHLAGLDPRAWAFTLGAAGLFVTSLLAGMWFRGRLGPAGWLVLLGILLVAAEWHLLWSAVSGMEVILFVALTVAIMIATERPGIRPEVIGFLIGMGMWVRPDAVTLVLILGVALLVRSGQPLERRAADLFRLGAGLVLPLVLYLAFNRWTAGTLWPSTFYSKQIEYAAHPDSPFLARFLRLAVDPRTGGPMTGPSIVLLPAAIFIVADSVHRGRSTLIGPALWALAYLALYAARLPETYQHGRYQVPVVPIVLLLGWEGISQLGQEFVKPRFALLSWGWAAVAVFATLGFVGLGGRAYALDVAIIETEMVETAHWIERNTPAEALIAAHDIGALGYFGGQDVLDLAGLTDPEVIPIVRDERALAELLFRSGADYLMTFPGWYPWLTECGEAVYASDGTFSPTAGGESMAVYRWPAVPSEGCMLYSP